MNRMISVVGVAIVAAGGCAKHNKTASSSDSTYSNSTTKPYSETAAYDTRGATDGADYTWPGTTGTPRTAYYTNEPSRTDRTTGTRGTTYDDVDYQRPVSDVYKPSKDSKRAGN